MTEHDLALALRDLSKSVTDHRYEIGRDLATLTANVGTLQTSHEGNAKKLDEVLRLELSCPARAGWEGMVGRLGGLETGERVRVESELQAARDEVTGINESDRIAPSRRWNDTRSTVFRALALKALPYAILGALFLIGYLVSGGDSEATARALRAVSDAVARVDSKIEKVEAKVDDVAVNADEVGR